MKIHYFLLTVVLWLGPAFSQSFGQGFVTVNRTQILGPDGHELHIKSIGLGNWLVQEGYMWDFGNNYSAPHEIKDLIKELIGVDAAMEFWQKYYTSYITKDDIAFLKECGFNTVRLPFNYRLLNPDDEPDTFTGPGWKALDDLIGWCKVYHIYVILDMHCAPGGETGANIDDSYGYPFLYETPASQERLIQLWCRIAEKYKNEPTVLGFDLMNEPLPHRAYYDRLVPLLEPLYKRVTAAIRKIDTRHLILLEGPDWDGSFNGFHQPFDSKLIYEFHYYWAPPTQAGIQRFLDFRDRYQVPIWLGESGENGDDWVATFRKLLETNDIGWSFWPYKKMNSVRGVVSVEVPDGWQKIVRFTDSCGGEEPKQAEHLWDSLPAEFAQKALSDYLTNIQLVHCRVNPGFLHALGLNAPPTYSH